MYFLQVTACLGIFLDSSSELLLFKEFNYFYMDSGPRVMFIDLNFVYRFGFFFFKSTFINVAVTRVYYIIINRQVLVVS